MVIARGGVAAALVLLILSAAPDAALAAQPATWNFQQAEVPAAQPLGNYGKGVLVAVVDTWIDYKDSEFGGRVVDEADCLTGTCQDHAYAPDSCVHGTHVAGTIASANYGVAPQSDILAVQVLSGPSGAGNPDASCSGTASSVAAGIDFAVSKGAKVINLSLADEVPFLFQPTDQAITDAVSNAFSHGVVVVIAAGNDSVPLSDNYGQDALVVAATGPSGQLASYSNSGPFISIAAPGGDSSSTCTAAECVLSTFPGNQLGLLEGTSMAAPHVSGLAALLVAQNPGRGISNVFSTIENTATPLAAGGSGLIDADKALEAEAVGHAPNATTPTQLGGSHVSSPNTGASATGGALPVGSEHGGSPAPTAGPSTIGSSRIIGTVPATPALTTTRRPGATPTAGEAAPTAAGTPKSKGLLPATSSNWAGHNAGILVVACLLVAADVLALLWRRRAWTPFHRE
jgi:subtilisin family serine protease